MMEKFLVSQDKIGMLKLTADLGKSGLLVELSDKDLNWHSIRLDKERVERLKKFLNETPIE